MRTPGEIERRAQERIPARIEIRFREAADAARTLRAFSVNVSSGGLCIRSRRPYAVGTSLRISMKVGDQAFALAGVVAWVRDGAVGIRFDGVTTQDQLRLDRLLKEQVRRA